MKKTFKKILFYLFSLAAMFSILCFGMSATSETPITGSYTNGSNAAMEWSLLDGKLTITHTCTANWSQISFNNTPWNDFVTANAANVKEISIVLGEGASTPNAISSWKQYNAFGRFKNCTKIITPGYIGRIGGLTWYNASSLTTYGPVGTPEGTIDLRGIYRYDDDGAGNVIKSAFYKVKATTVILPNKATPAVLTKEFQTPFTSSSITNVIVPENVTTLPSDFFSGCTITSVTFEGSSAENIASVLASKPFADSESLSFTTVDESTAKAIRSLYPLAVINGNKAESIEASLSMDGFGVRIADYNGLRGLFSVNKVVVDENETKGFTLLEYGTIVSSSENREKCVLVSDGTGGYTAESAIKTDVWNKDSGFVGKYLSDMEDKTEFALTVVNFPEKNYQSDVYFCAYEIWCSAYGDEEIIYTDCQGTDYDEVCLYDISYEMWKNGTVTEEMDEDSIVRDIINSVPLDGKRIIFIGNSHIFYGNTVLCKYATDTLTQEGRMNDEGYFYQLCKANGLNVNVTNWTIGNHLFDDFFSGSCSANRGCDGVDHASYLTDPYYDYVVACYGTKGQDNYVKWLDVMIDFFKEANPNVKFYLMAQSSAHGVDSRATGPDTVFLESLKTLDEKGVTVIDWGKIIADIVNGEIEVPGATLEYNKNTFVVNQSAKDGYHPNQLTGYITTLMTYSIITGESAIGQPYHFCGDDSYSSDYQYRTFDEFISTYYTYDGATTNYDKVFASEDDMEGIQKLIDKYIAEKAYENYEFE